MTKEKRYTTEQLSDAEQMAKALASVPKDKKDIVVMMANSFMAGMEAQKALDEAKMPVMA